MDFAVISERLSQKALAQGPEGSCPLFLKLAKIADDAIDEQYRLTAERGRPVACKPGCTACCHRVVSVTLPEAHAIASHVARNFSEERIQALVEGNGAYLQTLQETWETEEPAIHRACPFLDEEGLCGIYEYRPLACRGVNSFDAESCRLENEGRPTPPHSLESAHEIASGISNGISRASLRQGGAPELYDLRLIVAAILENSLNSVSRLATRSVFELPSRPFTGAQNRLLHGDQAREFFQSRGQGLIPTCSDANLPSALQAISAITLPYCYRDEGGLDEAWEHLGRGIERFENAAFEPGNSFAALRFVELFPLAYSGKDATPYLRRIAAKAGEIARAEFPHLVDPLPNRKPGPLRIAYLSHRLSHFNGSRWALGWLREHPADWDVYSVHLGAAEDLETRLWRLGANRGLLHLPFPVEEVVSALRDLDLDVAIFTDLGMGEIDLAISTMRIARRQYVSWGHPITSGSPQIDGFLSSEMAEPDDGQEHYVEQLVRLPGIGFSYPRPRSRVAERGVERFGLEARGYYLSCQTTPKYLPSYDELYVQISKASGRPIVLFEGLPEPTAILKARLSRAGANVLFLPRVPHDDYLELIQQSLAVLDTPGFNGGVTTNDALSLLRPVVSLEGPYLRGRLGKAFLSAAGANQLIATSVEDYVRIALDRDLLDEIAAMIEPSRIYADRRWVEPLNDLLNHNSES